MSLKPFIFAWVASLLMLSPVHAEDRGAEAAQNTGSPIEEQVRAYRERFEQHKLLRKQRQAEFERRREASRKRYDAMQKYYSERMQAHLAMIEERQQQIAARHEADRDRAQDRYNFLSSNSDALIKKALETQLEIAEHHEEIRKQAEQRYKKIAAYRDAMIDMTIPERRIYMAEHANEIFGQPGQLTHPAVPQRASGMMMQPPHPANGSVPRRPCGGHVHPASGLPDAREAPSDS